MNSRTSVPSGEPKQQNSKPTNSSGEPMNPDGETHEPKLKLNPQTCDSLGEGRFPLFFSFLFV